MNRFVDGPMEKQRTDFLFIGMISDLKFICFTPPKSPSSCLCNSKELKLQSFPKHQTKRKDFPHVRLVTAECKSLIIALDCRCRECDLNPLQLHNIEKMSWSIPLQENFDTWEERQWQRSVGIRLHSRCYCCN